MDLNKEYADHQRALIWADNSTCNDDRTAHFARAASIASRIGVWQLALGAACASSTAHVSVLGRA